MRKIIRVILISLGAVAAIAGFASLSFGVTSIFSKWMDAKTTEYSEPASDSKTKGSSSDSGGASSSSENPISSSSSDSGSSSSESPSSSSSEPSEPEEVALNLSKDKIYLSNEDHEGAAEDTITATVTGCDSTVSWLVTSSNNIAVSESTTGSGEANTVSCSAIFDAVQNIRVSLTDDPDVYKDVKVYYLNEPDQLALLTAGIYLGNGNYDRSILTRYNNPHTYNQDGVYFDCNTYMSSNRDGIFFDTVQESMEANKSLNVTYSPGATAAFEFKIRPYHKAFNVQWPSPYEDFEFTDYWNWYDEENSTLGYEEIACEAPQYITLYWVYRFNITLPDDFANKTGDVILNFGGKYFNIHFNAFIPGVTGVESEGN